MLENSLVILFYLLFGFLAMRNFKFSIYLVFLLLPSYRFQFDIFGFPFNLLSGLIWVLVFIFFFQNKDQIPNLFKNLKDNFKNKKNIFYNFRWPIILILISAYISTFFSVDKMQALGLFKSYFLEAILFFVILVFTFQKKKDFKNIIYSLQILAGLIFSVALYQKFSGNFIFNTTNILEQGRVTTFFGYPNANGLILLPIFFLSFINLLSDKKLYLKIFNILILILSFITMYWAKSESALIAVFSGLIIFGFFKLVKNKKIIKTLSLLVVLIALIFPFIVPAPKEIDLPGAYQYNFKQKILLQDLSGQIRRQMWQETENFLFDYPIFGAGLSSYQEKIKAYHKFDYIEIFLYPHNIFMNFWVCFGVFGLIGFLWVSVLLILKLTKNLNKNNFIILITFLAIIIQGIVEVPYFKNDLAIVWWLILSGYFICKD